MLPGLTREAEEQKLQEIIGIAQQNLERARADIRKVNEDLEDLLDVYEAQDKEGLALWNNATARLKENEYDLVRYEKARRKPYFGRIDFKDPNVKGDESYYIGRVGIAKNNSEPVVLDWRAPIASVYYESGLGPCQYTVSSEGTFTIDLKRKRTYEIENDHLKDFFDSDVVANDELLTKYLAKNKKAVLGEIIATIQKEQNLIIRRSPKTNIIVQGVAGSGKTTVAMHRISYILYNYSDDFRPEDFYIIGSNRILLNYITGVLPELDVLYMTRIQQERFASREAYLAQKDTYILTVKKLKAAKPDMIILHPLPRVDEIEVAVDEDPRAMYFNQARYGMYVRMALIITMLDLNKKDNPTILLRGTTVKGAACKNPNCITCSESYLPKSFLELGNGLLECEYCNERLLLER